MAVTIDPIDNITVKLFPDYIEHILNEHKDVERCAVVTIPSKKRHNVPIAFIKLHKNCKEDTERLDAFLLKKTEEYNKPEKYYFVDNIPFLPNGKINYQVLEKMVNEVS